MPQEGLSIYFRLMDGMLKYFNDEEKTYYYNNLDEAMTINKLEIENIKGIMIYTEYIQDNNFLCNVNMWKEFTNELNLMFKRQVYTKYILNLVHNFTYFMKDKNQLTYIIILEMCNGDTYTMRFLNTNISTFFKNNFHKMSSLLVIGYKGSSNNKLPCNIDFSFITNPPQSLQYVYNIGSESLEVYKSFYN